MFYLGFFSFNGKDRKGEPIFGHFCCLIEANSPAETEAKFQDLIHRYKGNRKAFSTHKSTTIYQDALIEVKRIPATGSLVFIYQGYGEEPAASISGMLPAREDGLLFFERKVQTTETDEHGKEVCEPFIEF